MKTTLENNNGTAYNVLAMTETEIGNVYLLTHTTEGGHIIKFVVARNWSDEYKCWECGKYFLVFNDLDEAHAAAENAYIQTVSALLYATF